MLFKSELRILLLNSGDPQSSLAHFLNSDSQGSPKFTRAILVLVGRADRRAVHRSHQGIVVYGAIAKDGKQFCRTHERFDALLSSGTSRRCRGALERWR